MKMPKIFQLNLNQKQWAAAMAVVGTLVGGGGSTAINAMREKQHDYSLEILALQIQMARVEVRLDAVPRIESKLDAFIASREPKRTAGYNP
jgi:hypothetical protein